MALGKTVRECQEGMDSAEFADWKVVIRKYGFQIGGVKFDFDSKAVKGAENVVDAMTAWARSLAESKQAQQETVGRRIGEK